MRDLNSEIIVKVKQLRIAKGITQKSIADALHLSANAYSRIENGNTQLTLNNLEIIAGVLGIPVAQLIENHGDKPNMEKNLEKIEKMGGGILLSVDQLKCLYEILQKMEI